MRPNLKPLKIDGQWVCLDCRTPTVVGRSWRGPRYPTLRCDPCRAARRQAHNKVKSAAHRAVSVAVQNGLLLPVRMHRCVDCRTKQAIDYDHRDYTKPLHVDPLCRSCNLRRGAGLGLPDHTVYRAQYRAA